MHTTCVSLLERVRRPADQAAWKRFVLLYTPLLHGWACRAGLQETDAADLVQEVFALLIVKLPEFQYDGTRSFRAWLKTVLRNKWREVCRRRLPTPMNDDSGPLADLADPAWDDERDEADYRQQLMQRALQLMERDFQPTTWKAWQQFAVAGRPAADVAAELGITAQAVYLAKVRVLQRLREELEGLLD